MVCKKMRPAPTGRTFSKKDKTQGLIMNEFIITTLVGVFTALGGWVAGRKKNIAERRITEFEAVEKAITVWRNLGEDAQRRYDEIQKRYDAVITRQLEIEKELTGLREDNARLSRENRELIRKLKKLEYKEET